MTWPYVLPCLKPEKVRLPPLCGPCIEINAPVIRRVFTLNNRSAAHRGRDRVVFPDLSGHRPRLERGKGLQGRRPPIGNSEHGCAAMRTRERSEHHSLGGSGGALFAPLV